MEGGTWITRLRTCLTCIIDRTLNHSHFSGLPLPIRSLNHSILPTPCITSDEKR